MTPLLSPAALSFSRPSLQAKRCCPSQKPLALVQTFFVLGLLFTSQSWGQEPERPRILFLGDSLTAGYGLSEKEAYPQHIQEKLNAEGWNYQVVNAGISGDTSAGGLRRIGWLLRQKTDILVLALGANDGLRGIPTETTQQNLENIIQKAKATYPDIQVLVAGMKLPPNLGGSYSKDFEAIFSTLSQKSGATQIPFLLEGVAGDPTLNLADGIHPNSKGQKILADTVWPFLKPLLTQRSAPKKD